MYKEKKEKRKERKASDWLPSNNANIKYQQKVRKGAYDLQGTILQLSI